MLDRFAGKIPRPVCVMDFNMGKMFEVFDEKL